ncbi:MAG: M20/M25/M40 family metallo-hydrolase [Armatimonadota bacterium]|nr:M20/M25/M40 family metallo-hydrolase [Armatimonadota bacterium]
MIDVQTMVEEFCELVRVDSPSLHEAEVNALIRDRLAALGIDSEMDDAGDPIGGEAGNIIARMPGREGAPTVMLNAHTDTVEPGRGINPQVDGTVISSDGSTILGADDKAGVTIILTLLAHLREEDLPHPPLEIVFTVGEEVGLCGAKALDYTDLEADMGYVLDGGRTMGVITAAAPSSYKLGWRVQGVAAHAGVCPERGVNSIQVAAEAIAEIPLGRLDFETTANIGVIRGGEATNIVPELTTVDGEARSHDDAKLEAQKDRMLAAFEEAAQRHEAKVEADAALTYRSFEIGEDQAIYQYAHRAAEGLGFEPQMERGGGGSDANVFNENGIPSLILATGPAEVHTVNEWVDAELMADSARWLAEILDIIVADAGA